MLDKINKQLGISIIDWTISVWWVTKEARLALETPIGKLPQPEQSVGFTIGPFFFSLDRDGESVFMVCPWDSKWLSNWDWFWGRAKTVGEMWASYEDEDDIDTVPYNRDPILPPAPVFNSRGAVLTAQDVEFLKNGSGNAGDDTWLSDEDIASLQQFAMEQQYNTNREV